MKHEIIQLKRDVITSGRDPKRNPSTLVIGHLANSFII